MLIYHVSENTLYNVLYSTLAKKPLPFFGVRETCLLTFSDLINSIFVVTEVCQT